MLILAGRWWATERLHADCMEGTNYHRDMDAVMHDLLHLVPNVYLKGFIRERHITKKVTQAIFVRNIVRLQLRRSKMQLCKIVAGVHFNVILLP